MRFAIQTSGLTRQYADLTAVDHVDLQVPGGSVYGFLGPNGAGKTTTIRMLLGLIRPNQGEVQLFGQPLKRQNIALLGRVGALVEMPSLYPNLTGRENLEVTRRLLGTDKRLIDRALSIVHLNGAADKLVRKYSLGMKQRLGIALALLNQPQLLILDEPTNGLDPAGIHEIRDLIRSLPTEYGITVFLSSHLLSEVEQVATHIGIINHGKLIFQNTIQALQVERREHVKLGTFRPDVAISLLQKAGYRVRESDEDLLMVDANGRTEAAQINRSLVQSEQDVFHLTLERLTLEDIFLKLTNDTLPEGAGA
jgi:ABC-type multidrug transport system ATPase subunit